MIKITWNGVYPALLTPFTADENIDFEMFKINLKAQVDAGIAGIVIAGSLGEASTLTNDEKKQLFVAAREFLPSDMPIIINIAESSTKEAVKLAQDAEAYGADGLMLLPPMRYYAGDAEVVEFFKAVATSTKLPIMLYNNPVDYKIKITLEMFEELRPFANIQAVKESTRDVTNITRMINHFGDRFKILTGVDPLALESLVMGADGWIAGLVDAFPAETVAIYNLVKAGEIKAAVDIYRWFMPLLELDTHPRLVQYIKLAAKAEGIGTEHVRSPRIKLTGEERTRVQKVIDDALAVRPTLPNYKHLNQSAHA